MTVSDKRQAWVKYLGALGFHLVLLYCLFCAIFTRSFAQLHIKFFFLDFPIFVGEILLFLCALLVLAIDALKKQKPKLWYLLIVAYGAWVLFGAILGFLDYGPLALRNAALFYYLFFAVFAYEFYLLNKLTDKMAWLYLFILLTVKFTLSINNYYVYPVLATNLTLLTRVKVRWLKLILFVLILYTPAFYFNPANFGTLEFFFMGGRSRVLGHLAAIFVIIFGCLMGGVRFSRRMKFLVFGAGTLFLIFGLSRFADQNALGSMMKITEGVQRFKYYDLMAKKRQQNYRREDFEVNLFSEEVRSFGEDLSIFVKQVNPLYNQQQAVKLRQLEDAAFNIEQRKADIMQGVVDRARGERQKALDAARQVLSEKKNKKKLEIIREFEKVKQARIQKIKTKYRNLSGEELQRLIDEALWEIEKNKDQQLQLLDLQIQGELQAAIQAADRKFDAVVQSAANEAREIKVKSLKQAIEIMGLEGQITVGQAQLMSEDRDDSGYRRLDTAYNNIFFRLFIWRDMIQEMIEKRAWGGINWGQPQRAISLELLGWARREWSRDGWVAPHNSYLHMAYRGGVIGLLLVLCLGGAMIYLFRQFVRLRSIIGILLVSVLVYWGVMGMTLVFLEVPYFAIPFWSMLGMSIAYVKNIRKQPQSEEAR